MKWLFIPCLILGSLLVFQPLLNRIILEQKGLSFAATLNSFIAFSLGSSVFMWVYFSKNISPQILAFKTDGPWYWWYILPGIFGFALVFLTPVMIKYLGAFTAALALMSGQIITSLIVDALLSGIAISTSRILGLTLALAGAYLSFKPDGMS